MKTTLLLVILALSVNAFAQTKLRASHLHHPTSNSIENFHGLIPNEGLKTSILNSLKFRNKQEIIKKSQKSSLIQIYDSICEWHWDTLSFEWKIKSKTINMVYDLNNNLITKLQQNCNGITCLNTDKDIYTYDASNNQTGFLRQTYSGSAWVNSYQFLYSYDANNNQTNALYQTWNAVAWVDSIQTTFTYDDNNNQTSELYQVWNGSTWENSDLHNYTYDSNNNLTSVLWQLWNGAWTNYEQIIFSYDSNNNRTSELWQVWALSSWMNSAQKTYTYDDFNNQISYLYVYWTGSAWENYVQYLATYDASNNRTNELWQEWGDSQWWSIVQTNYTYDVFNNETNYITQYWWGDDIWMTYDEGAFTYDGDNFALSFTYKNWNFTLTPEIDSTYYYFHTEITGINTLIAESGNIIVYPNPGNGKFTISSNSTISSIEIYNMSGKLIYSDLNLTQLTSKEIDLTNEQKGIYFARLLCGSEIYIRKIAFQ